MGALEGRVAIITGAGRGIGREHALLFAAEGAKVVINDLGAANDGSGADVTPAEEVAAEIRAQGGEAISNGDDVADWEGAQRLINAAISTFGTLDILVNNAGILRDRVIVNMTEQEWDAVIAVHLKGHFAPTRWAAAYWREEHKAGRGRRRNLVHTSSTSGLFSNPGQSNYGAAKSGIATFSQIAAKELTRYDVTSNCIAPGRGHASRSPRPDSATSSPPRTMVSTSGTPPTSRRSSPTSAARHVRSPVRRSSCRVASSSGSSHGRWRRRSSAQVDGPLKN